MFGKRVNVVLAGDNTLARYGDINSNLVKINVDTEKNLYDDYLKYFPDINFLTGNSSKFIVPKDRHNTSITKKPVGIDILLYRVQNQRRMLLLDHQDIYVISDVINYVGINSMEYKPNEKRKILNNIANLISDTEQVYGTLFLPRQEYIKINTTKKTSYINMIKNFILFQPEDRNRDLGFSVSTLQEWEDIAKKLEFTGWLILKDNKWDVLNTDDNSYSTGGTWFSPVSNRHFELTDENISKFNDSYPSEYSSIKRIFTESLDTRGYDSISDVIVLENGDLIYYYYYVPYDMSFFPTFNIKTLLSPESSNLYFERFYRLIMTNIMVNKEYAIIIDTYLNFFRYLITMGYSEICDIFNDEIFKSFANDLYKFDEFRNRTRSRSVSTLIYISSLFQYLSLDFFTYFSTFFSVLMLNRFKISFLKWDKKRISDLVRGQINEERPFIPQTEYANILLLDDYDKAPEIISENWEAFNNFVKETSCVLLSVANVNNPCNIASGNEIEIND